MKYSEKLENGGGKGARPTSNVSTPEGGSDMALALTNAIQGQASEMLVAAQAAQISIDHASDRLSDYYARVLSNQELLGMTMMKTQKKIQEMGGTVTINTDVKMVEIEIPESPTFGDIRQNFAGLFGGKTTTVDPSYILSGPTAADEVASDA